jgi:hypothetical protein
MEDLSQSSTDALSAVVLASTAFTFGHLFILVLIGTFAPHLFLALFSALPHVCGITLCAVEILSSHDLGLRLSGNLLRKGLHFIGLDSFDSVLRALPVVLGINHFLLTFSGLLVVILALAHLPPPSSQLLMADCYKTPPNPDIVGLGVRYSIYALMFCLFISLFVASFHWQQSGTKELGCMVLISA